MTSRIVLNIEADTAEELQEQLQKLAKDGTAVSAEKPKQTQSKARKSQSKPKQEPKSEPAEETSPKTNSEAPAEDDGDDGQPTLTTLAMKLANNLGAGALQELLKNNGYERISEVSADDEATVRQAIEKQLTE